MLWTKVASALEGLALHSDLLWVCAVSGADGVVVGDEDGATRVPPSSRAGVELHRQLPRP